MHSFILLKICHCIFACLLFLAGSPLSFRNSARVLCPLDEHGHHSAKLIQVSFTTLSWLPFLSVVPENKILLLNLQMIPVF